MVNRQERGVRVDTAGLPDLSDVDLTTLGNLPPQLQRAADEVVAQVNDEANPVISAFQSFAS